MNYLVGLRAGDADAAGAVSGSVTVPCIECELDVLVSPASKELAQKHEALVICGECVGPLEYEDVQPITREQWAEVEDWIRRNPNVGG